MFTESAQPWCEGLWSSSVIVTGAPTGYTALSVETLSSGSHGS